MDGAHEGFGGQAATAGQHCCQATRGLQAMSPCVHKGQASLEHCLERHDGAWAAMKPCKREQWGRQGCKWVPVGQLLTMLSSGTMPAHYCVIPLRWPA